MATPLLQYNLRSGSSKAAVLYRKASKAIVTGAHHDFASIAYRLRSQRKFISSTCKPKTALFFPGLCRQSTILR